MKEHRVARINDWDVTLSHFTSEDIPYVLFRVALVLICWSIAELINTPLAFFIMGAIAFSVEVKFG